jgi:hypothetical protein
MTNQDSDGLFDYDGDESRELSWTEADWEKYLGEHEVAVRDYLKNYDQLSQVPDRVDEVARRMGWEMEAEESDETEESLDADAAAFDADFEPYTLHRNPVHIATKALYASLIANWERIAAQPGRVSAAQGITVAGALYRGREHALQAVQALDLGDYSLAVCFFKRALREMNETLARLSAPESGDPKLLTRYREYATPRLFDLREIWLRVMAECRIEDSEG